MRIFAISDIHTDFEANWRWLDGLSKEDYKNDILILAGDVTDKLTLLEKTFLSLQSRFMKVVFVPGNHDLWVFRSKVADSLVKFQMVKDLAQNCGILMEPFNYNTISVIPLYGWYDYSFGNPSSEIQNIWADYMACRWPRNYDEKTITAHFTSMNEAALTIKNDIVISFSHFVPRIDLMPGFIPPDKRVLYPVLGSYFIEKQIRSLKPQIHVYGHSHVNNSVVKDGIQYINNAFGYPYETGITAKRLKCIYEG
ncbi:MAG: metallophosphoesterase [Clostridia bacterium]|nr:metallophosphoesterase [Clostridia bacterium]